MNRWFAVNKAEKNMKTRKVVAYKRINCIKIKDINVKSPIDAIALSLFCISLLNFGSELIFVKNSITKATFTKLT